MPNSAQNVELTLRFVQKILNAGDFSGADEFLSPDFVEHSAPPGFPGNREGVERVFRMLHTAFPDFQYTVENTVAEGDLVALRITASGTMQGDLMGNPATGKHATWPEFHLARVQNGKIVEHWDVIDRLARLEQLGLFP